LRQAKVDDHDPQQSGDHQQQPTQDIGAHRGLAPILFQCAGGA
jgi:hypothetical protein